MLFSFCSPWLSSNIHPLPFAFPRPARLHPLCFSIFVHSIFYDLLCNLSLWRKYSGAMTGYISHPSFFFSLLSSHSDLCVWVRWLTMEPCSYGPAFNEIPPTTNLGFCYFNLLSFNAYFGYDLEKSRRIPSDFWNLRRNLIFLFSHEWLKVETFLMLNESTHEFGSLKKVNFVFQMEASSIPWD